MQAMRTLDPTAILEPDQQGVRHAVFRALGTKCAIKFRHDDRREALHFVARALEWLGNFEAKYSRFRPDSLISRINAAAGGEWVAVDAEAEQILEVAEELFERTNGILDPTMLPLLRVWDWRVAREALPRQEDVDEALALVGWRSVQRRPGAVRLPRSGMGLDLGGFGKELAVDALAKIATASGVADALIDLGCDVYALGGNGAHPFWHVGVESGASPGTCWAGLAVSGRAVSSSGNYARQFTHDGVRYGHILDPRTGWPVRNGLTAVTVVGRTCLEAGIYSTAVFVLGAEEGLRLSTRTLGVDVCIQSEDGTQGSSGFGRWLVERA